MLLRVGKRARVAGRRMTALSAGEVEADYAAILLGHCQTSELH